MERIRQVGLARIWNGDVMGSSSMGGMEDKAKDALSGGRGDEAIDKAAQKADQMTGRKASGGIDKSAQEAKDELDKFGNKK